MAKKVLGILIKDIWFYIFSIASIGLIIASFLVPPMGVIDGTVLAAIGELFGWGVLGTVIKAINEGIGATVQHNNTTITVQDQDGKND